MKKPVAVILCASAIVVAISAAVAASAFAYSIWKVHQRDTSVKEDRSNRDAAREQLAKGRAKSTSETPKAILEVIAAATQAEEKSKIRDHHLAALVRKCKKADEDAAMFPKITDASSYPIIAYLAYKEYLGTKSGATPNRVFFQTEYTSNIELDLDTMASLFHPHRPSPGLIGYCSPRLIRRLPNAHESEVMVGDVRFTLSGVDTSTLKDGDYIKLEKPLIMSQRNNWELVGTPIDLDAILSHSTNLADLSEFLEKPTAASKPNQ